MRRSLVCRRLVLGGWCLYTFDRLNIALEPLGLNGEDRRLYYPDLPSALQALFRRLVAEGSREAGDLQGVLRAIESAERRLVAAVEATQASTAGE